MKNCWLAIYVFLAVQFAVPALASEDVQLNVQSWVHFNTNVSNFESSREFYGKLGFETLTGFPDTNTLEMAQAIGITTPTEYDGSRGDHAGGYLLHGELIAPGGFLSGVIDLIEFSIPRNEEPPYPSLNRLGMVRAVLETTSIDADYDYLSGLGVSFLSEPVTRADGTRFAIFKDPDGTFYELEEVDGEIRDSETTQIVRVGRVVVNVSDYERSLQWYGMLGFAPARNVPATDTAEVARAMGFNAPFEVKGSILEHQVDGSEIELVQWLTPFDPTPPYDIPVNHIGIHRMALATSDIHADVELLRSKGVQFVSDITPCCSGPDSSSSIVLFYDPDGTLVELVEQPFFMQLLMPVFRWINRTF